jgi:hypothetical protein
MDPWAWRRWDTGFECRAVQAPPAHPPGDPTQPLMAGGIDWHTSARVLLPNLSPALRRTASGDAPLAFGDARIRPLVTHHRRDTDPGRRRDGGQHKEDTGRTRARGMVQ